MGNVETTEYQAPSGAGIPGENLRVVLLRMIHEVSHQMVQDASRTAEERTRRWMEENLGVIFDRIRKLEEAVTELDERHESRIRKVEERLIQLERCQGCTKSDGSAKLEERVFTLEQSVERALQSVLPRVELLINQLDGRPVDRMMDFTTCAPPPTNNNQLTMQFSTQGLPTPPPDVVAPFTKDDNMDEALRVACRDGKVDEVLRLLNAGANIECKDGCGCNPIHWAIQRCQADVLALLIRRGANIHARTDFGWTALHVAAKMDCRLCLGYLLRAGADISSRDSNGWTPLHWAATEDRDGSIRMLLAAGANPDVRDNFGMLPIDLAGTEAIRKILKRPKSVDVHWATMEDSDGSIRMLLAAGANPDVRDNFGMLTIDLAGTEAIRKILKR